MYSVFAAELTIWSMACIAKLKVMNSQLFGCVTQHEAQYVIHKRNSHRPQASKRRAARETRETHLGNGGVHNAPLPKFIEQTLGDLSARRAQRRTRGRHGKRTL